MAKFNTSWDVDKYKNSYESDEHWQLRRQFMVAHKHKFPEFRLVCLTQVFFNMEFLGCKYPEKTMEIVNGLAEEVAEEFRESRKGKLKRTFVGAQDAAGAKAKGMKPPPGATEGSQNKLDSDVVNDPPPTKKARLDEVDEPTPSNKQVSDDSNLNQFEADLKEIAKTFVLMIPTTATSTKETHPVKIIDHNFHRKNKVFQFSGNRESGWSCVLTVNPGPETTKSERSKYTIASCFDTTQGQAKYQAADVGVESLKRFCTYVEPNPDWLGGKETPEFIKKRIPCSKSPPTYMIMNKTDTGRITAKVADDLFETFKKSSSEDMFFIDTEFEEDEKINLMNRSPAHGLRFRHFGSKGTLKDHHACIYKTKPASEIVEEARKLGWKHPKFTVFLKNP